MIARKALPIDSPAIASCLLLAMEDIVYKMMGVDDAKEALSFMQYFVEQENNQYSWQNCWVVEEGGRVVGAVTVYDGAKLYELRLPVVDYIRSKFSREIFPEDETQAGEYYIDSIGVHPEFRGRGIATHLLQFLIEEYVVRQQLTLGLLVDGGSSAERLYMKLGFKPMGRKALLGKRLEHMQISR